ncbi:UbiA family prenyltransferase [Actinoplanes sp. CA-252034]|uniref:UbiA family prenyltransferase n=1 Tax=Actinoplanes sp. CA-252034 TaxID=3239906 RepID=UPI003D966DD4
MTSWRDIARLVRAPAALSVPGDVVAGAAAAGTLRPRTLGLAGASVCLYWAGMAANDWADRHIDAVERPGRPIPSGRVRPGTALGIAAGLTGAGLALAAAAGGGGRSRSRCRWPGRSGPTTWRRRARRPDRP